MCPLRRVWVAPGWAGATLKKIVLGDPPLFEWHYTRGGRAANLEICIWWIRFSDWASWGWIPACHPANAVRCLDFADWDTALDVRLQGPGKPRPYKGGDAGRRGSNF